MISRLLLFASYSLLAADGLALAGNAPPSVIPLTLPSLDWTLAIETPSFALEQKAFYQTDEGEAARFFATNPLTGVVMSAFLEKAPREGDARVCRSFYLDKLVLSPTDKSSLRFRESGPVAIREYILTSSELKGFKQNNLNAYLSHRGYWIDIHLSKVNLELQPDSVALFTWDFNYK